MWWSHATIYIKRVEANGHSLIPFTVNSFIKIDKKISWKIVTYSSLKISKLQFKKKDEHDSPYSWFLNKASLVYACLDTNLILWSKQRGPFKLGNHRHKHQTEHQSLVDPLSLSFLVYWTKAKLYFLQFKLSH